MSATTRVLPLSAKIETSHARKHAKSPRDWCPLCVGSPAPVAPSRPEKAPALASATPKREVPAQVREAAGVLAAFLAEFDLAPSVDILRALAQAPQAGVGTPAPKRTRRPGVVPAGHPVSRNGHPLRGAALAKHQARAEATPVREVPSGLASAYEAGLLRWDGDVLVAA